ncbi:MAG: RdgB/HAM1 family non-canonical purine NTP pyrophosphatase [Clostridiales bacterium]|nr:RdgB/HAM1 family non-canonical purine NTP pyrophosphatase [Candidatus Apopatousia equi]
MKNNTIIFASQNENKVKEVKEMLKDYNVVSLNDIGFNEEIDETGTTFYENALIKCNAIKSYLDKQDKSYIILADDSGLCVDSLNGEPGVYSARYAGTHGNNQANRDKILSNLIAKENRDAHFVCSMVLMDENGKVYSCEGKTFGRILEKECGDKTFCYDCIFFSNDLQKCFGECTSAEKDSVSHRGRAVEKIKEILKEICA